MTDGSATPKRLGSYIDVARLVGMSRRSVERAVAAGRFPQPIRLGKRMIRFDLDALNTWITDRCPAQSNSAN